MKRRFTVPSLAVLLAGLFGCQQQQPADIPNRVLDRPTDIAFVCAEISCVTDEAGNETCTTQPLSLSGCESEVGSCAADNPHLVGFVANSERNEIAMFTKCSNRLVDMDVSSPGYDFIPAGLLPTELDASADGCWVVSANVGSCDLTELDAPGLARFGLGAAADLGRTEEDPEPSALVSTLVPRTFDPEAGRFRPLGARPGQILMVPYRFTQAPGIGQDQALSGLCDPLVRRSAYVSFPTCNLVAEVDLQTGNILQSRKFLSDGLGGVDVVDTGISPSCPVECPVQFEGELPSNVPSIDASGPFVQALALSLEPPPPSDSPDPGDTELEDRYDEADAAAEGQRLYVGGLGSDILFELPISDAGAWSSESNQLRLAEAGGIKGIDVSPPVNAEVGDDAFSRFLYVIAGDGSTRVVGRGLPGEPDVLGIECETQADPSLLGAGTEISACIPVAQSPYPGQPPERRGFSRGPGIRPGRGEEVTDWMFRKVYEYEADGEAQFGPFAEPTTTAIGVTTGGFALYTMINHSRANGSTTPVDLLDDENADPSDIMDVRLFAHSLWPEPVSDAVASLPLVLDAEPARSTGSGATNAVRPLSPSLRRIDAAYVDDERAKALLNIDGDFDGLGEFYDEPVVRAVVHDYRSWGSSGGPNWVLEWEGTIPGTQSATGRVDCATPGWNDGTCVGETKLVDSGATFCDDGVLRGDKLVLIGCTTDDNCGEGRKCLRETVAGGKSSGICISAAAYDERASELRKICGPFISDPCGEAYREYTITKATQDTLWIEAMDQPLLSHVVDTPCEDTENAVLVGDTCMCLPGFEACAEGCCQTAEYIEGQAPVLEHTDQYVCTNFQPDPECEADTDCRCDPELDAELGCDASSANAVCIEGLCRRPCEDGEDCVFRRLPGPACFAEFVRYQVALRNEFRVSGPGFEFLSNRVEVSDQPDAAGDYVCRETQNPVFSQLLTSRLPLPASDDPDDPEWLAIPVCDDDGIVEPGDPNPCRVTASRASANKFHVLRYEDSTVSALRFSNPVFSIVLDLTALDGLTAEVRDYDDSFWPLAFTQFSRARIPRTYRTGFGLESAYIGYATRLLLEGRPVTYPIRIVPGPQSDVAYVVDGSGPGSSSSIRGQVVRLFLGGGIDVDNVFTGVR